MIRDESEAASLIIPLTSRAYEATSTLSSRQAEKYEGEGQEDDDEAEAMHPADALSQRLDDLTLQHTWDRAARASVAAHQETGDQTTLIEALEHQYICATLGLSSHCDSEDGDDNEDNKDYTERTTLAHLKASALSVFATARLRLTSRRKQSPMISTSDEESLPYNTTSSRRRTYSSDRGETVSLKEYHERRRKLSSVSLQAGSGEDDHVHDHNHQYSYSGGKVVKTFIAMLSIAAFIFISIFALFVLGNVLVGPPNQPVGPYKLIDVQVGIYRMNIFIVYSFV